MKAVSIILTVLAWALFVTVPFTIVMLFGAHFVVDNPVVKFFYYGGTGMTLGYLWSNTTINITVKRTNK